MKSGQLLRPQLRGQPCLKRFELGKLLGPHPRTTIVLPGWRGWWLERSPIEVLTGLFELLRGWEAEFDGTCDAFQRFVQLRQFLTDRFGSRASLDVVSSLISAASSSSTRRQDTYSAQRSLTLSLTSRCLSQSLGL
jgi:hypothetical protein